jgi:hypothetical protein
VAANAPVEVVVGTVEIVTIEDRLAGETYRHVGLRPVGGRALILVGTALDHLVDGGRAEVEGQRDSDTLFVIRARPLGGPASRSTAKLSVTGTVRLMHADYFESGQSEFLMDVARDDGSSVRLDVTWPFAQLVAGMRVTVTGESSADGDRVRPSFIVITAPAPPAQPMRPRAAPDAVTNSVLVILMRYANSPANPFTQAQVQTVFAGGPGSGSVTEYYKETSYGLQLLNATITNWLQSGASVPAGCNISTMMTDGNALATAAGYTIGNYQNLVYVFPRVSGCGWAGLAYIGWGRALINGYNTTSVYAHELGHNFGLLHAGSLRCPSGNIIDGACTVSEYGDPFDVMGNQSAMHFNAAQKSYLNWIPGPTVLTQAAGSGTYRLDPLELANGSRYAVTIPTRRNRTFWLEYRQPIGFDSGLASRPNNGPQVRLETPLEWSCSGCDTTLLDMEPSTSTFNDATLVAGKNFRDPVTGVSVSVLGATPTALDLFVQMAGQPIIADFNGDGKGDILWRNPTSGATLMWLMNGGAPTATATIMPDRAWMATHVGDFNGDGRSDIVWRNTTTGETALWLMNGATIIGGGQIMPTGAWMVTQIADFNGDGRSDIVWRNLSSGETVIWLMQGMSILGGYTVMSDANWVVAYTSDFNADGKADLVWRHLPTGQTALWLMNGATYTAAAGIMNDPNWTVTHAADFNGDGKADLVWRNTLSGATALWIMNGLSLVSGVGLQSNPSAQVTHAVDLTGDGKADLVWRNVATGQTSAWLMNGTAVTGAAQLLADGNYSVARVGDFDGNGRADLVWRNTATGATVLWLMNGVSPVSGHTLSTDPSWHVQP